MTRLPPELYQTVTNSIPIVCVDLIPIKQVRSEWQIGVITRATGPETGKLAILGGRIYHDEFITDAIARHMKTDWGISDYRFWEGNTISRPFYVQQYLHAKAAELPYGYDPGKHAIALTYLIELSKEPRPRNEASAFHWIEASEVPEPAAYDQHLVMAEAFKFLLSQR